MKSQPLDGAAFTPVQARNDRSFFLRRDGEGSTAYGRRIFSRVFTHDVERVLGMEVSTPLHHSRPAPPRCRGYGGSSSAREPCRLVQSGAVGSS